MLTIYLAGVFIGVLVGTIAGAAIAVWVVLRWWPRVTLNQVVVTPEAIARGIAAGGGIHCSTPSVLVDWTIIHTIIEAQGYTLIAKREPGVPKRH